MKVLVYGGSFDPPHIGHIRSVQVAAAALEPDQILLIPAAEPPHKALSKASPPAAERLAMAELAAGEIPGCQASDVELERSGPSYTSDTLRQLRQRYPAAELIFLMGTDMLLTLEDWHEPETILSLASAAVFARETGREREIEAAAARLRQRYGATVYVLSGEPVRVSSTQVRALLPARRGRELVPESVYGYIIQKRLYGAKPDFDWLREKAYAYLKPGRVPHVQGTEAEARSLAARWGVDVDDAAEAAIVHDITKKCSYDEQLCLCEKYGIIPDACQLASEKLLHSLTGGPFAAERFGIPEHIVQAVRWHTTGRPAMTDLQRIVYLADYIEPNRHGFSGLAELRQAAYEDLDAAMDLALRMSLAEVREKGRQPHEDTVTAQQYYEKRLKERGVPPVAWTPEADQD